MNKVKTINDEITAQIASNSCQFRKESQLIKNAEVKWVSGISGNKMNEDKPEYDNYAFHGKAEIAIPEKDGYQSVPYDISGTAKVEDPPLSVKINDAISIR